MMLVTMCVCVFIKLHITAQSGPVILVILCHSHPPKGGSMILVTSVCVCMLCACSHLNYSGGQTCGLPAGVIHEESDRGLSTFFLRCLP